MKQDLIFIPSPGIGHLASTIELANRLVDRNDDRFSITVLLIRVPFAPTMESYAQSLSATYGTRIQFINLPPVDPPSPDLLRSPEKYVSVFIESNKPHIRHAIGKLVSNSVKLAGLVVDLFCTSMIDVAKEFGLPSYLFFTSSAAFLGLMLDLPTRHEQIGTSFTESDPESMVSTFVNPVPSSVLPSGMLDACNGGYDSFLYHARRFSETKGIIVNTFAELESYALRSLSGGPTPTVYPVGPLLDLDQSRSGGRDEDKIRIMQWLDDQPISSVVFLCFGSLGSFDGHQLRQIAIGLERSGLNFLWSIRQPQGVGQSPIPSDDMSHKEVLPEGFIERTKGKGMICGWAPQKEILAHPAIGGFVSHCGWNSILESIWFGVPIVTWPIYAEQQTNAFEMVRELGLALELKLDYRKGGDLVMADEIERAVRCVMEHDNPVRMKVKEIGQKSREALLEGGSSFNSLGCFIENMLGNHS